MNINDNISRVDNEFQRMRLVSKIRQQDAVQAPSAAQKAQKTQAPQAVEKTALENNFKMIFSDTALTKVLTRDEKAFITKVFQNEELNFSDGYTRGSHVSSKPKLGQNIDVKA